MILSRASTRRAVTAGSAVIPPCSFRRRRAAAEVGVGLAFSGLAGATPSALKNRAVSSMSIPPRTSTSSATMELNSYAAHSKNQYAAHLLTRDLLSTSMERLATRCRLEDRDAISHGMSVRRRRIADLGSADGSSSMETLKFAMQSIGDNLPLHITFEEHPASSKEKLEAALNASDDWFIKHDVTREVLMKSFYEPLFEPESIDFMMSYICTHWLDSTDVSEGGSIAEWKTLGATDKADTSQLGWTQVNEFNTPGHVREAWRVSLAHRHLAKFLSLRSIELRAGAELLLVMVGEPHEFVTPSDGGPGPLSRAMKRCIDRGELRREVLHRTVVPYFLRSVKDVESALTLAVEVEMEGKGTPGALLQLIDCKSVPVTTRGDCDIIGGAFDLFWSIHLNSVESANPTMLELQCIKAETRLVFDEIYDCEVGVPSSFVACTLRKRTRECWDKFS